MNAKQTAPIVATLASIAPPLLIGGAIFFALKWLLSNDDKKKKPETAPANTAPEHQPLHDPLNSGEKSNVSPVPSVLPAPMPAVVPLTKNAAQAPLPPSKTITREDMANIFNRGARALTRKDAVATLIRLGFGQTAAYRALSPDGRFASWLQFAPDGIITWNN